jgi:hypothetical protein
MPAIREESMAKHAAGRKAICLTMDIDAIDILKVMSPSGKGYGNILGELVRQEARRRELRKQPGYLEELFRDEPVLVASNG